MAEDDTDRPVVASTDTDATVVYESSYGGRVEKSGPVIYEYGEAEDDPESVHLLVDTDRVLAASTTTNEVRTVAVEETLVEEVSETPGPEGYDVLAAKHYGRKVGENPTIELND